LYELLQAHRLPGGISWSEGTAGRKNAILVDTVSRFKGLEAPVVILWLGDEIIDGGYQELLYVGITRAKSLLYVVGSKLTLPLIS
jgi:superfamily I DNA/RNA helicase